MVMFCFFVSYFFVDAPFTSVYDTGLDKFGPFMALYIVIAGSHGREVETWE